MKVVVVEDSYVLNVRLFNALADTNRLIIVDMLSSGEICACKILEKLQITQPTLSHHTKNLCNCGLVIGRKEGKWTYYSLASTQVQNMRDFLQLITMDKDECICKPTNEECCNG